MTRLGKSEAEKLAMRLRDAASDACVDLTDKANRSTLWFENGGQGFLRKGSGKCMAAMWRLIGDYQLGDAVILEAGESGTDSDQLTVLSTARS